MVSRFGYPSFKQFDLDRRVRFFYMLLAVLVIIAVALVVNTIDPPALLLAVFGTYALSAPLIWIGRRLRRLVRGSPTAAG